MATAYLMASFPDAYTKEGLILGNPEAAVTITPGAAYPGSPQMTFSATSHQYRVLSIVCDVELSVLQVSQNETSAAAKGVATKVPPPASGQASYACLIHPSTVALYVKTP